MRTFALLPLLTTLAPWPSALRAADRTWDGGDATANMTAAANWNLNTPINPATDQLIFPSGLPLAERTVNNNFPVNTVFSVLKFYEGGYTLNGTVASLSGGIGGFHSSGTVTINSSFTLEAGQYFTTLDAGDLTFGAGSQIFTNGQVLNLSPGNAASTITLAGFVAGSGVLNVMDSGTVILSGAKTFNGNVRISKGGTLRVDHNTSLGSATGNTSLEKATLVIDSAAALNIAEDLRMTNASPDQSVVRSQGGAHTLSGDIFMENGSFKVFDVQGAGLTLSGAITGESSFGSFTKEGPGRLTLAGAKAGSAGIQILRVREGELLLNKTPGVDAFGSPFLIMGTNAGPVNSAITRLAASHQIPDSSDVDVSSDGWLDVNGQQETIRNLSFIGSGQVSTGTGKLRLGGNLDAFSAAQQGGAATLSGNVELLAASSDWEVAGGNIMIQLNASAAVSATAPNAVLNKTGGGLLNMSGNLSIPTLRLKDGMLNLSGVSPATDVVAEKGDLRAAGSLRKITVEAGSLSIGGDQSNADLVCGDLTLSANSSVIFTASDATPGGHDFVHVKGAVTLNSAGLGLLLVLPSIAVGQEVVLVENDGADAISGQFKNLAEGGLLNGQYVVSYQGGDGNDFSITRIVPPTGITRIWDGGGADDNWMTAANWNPNGTPEAGDDLFFPTSASRKNNINNFPAGTTFNSISVNGTGYGIGGNGIFLNKGIEWTSANASAMWGMPVTLALDASLSIKGETFVQVISSINTNGHRLTLHNAGGGDGDLYLDSISGSGSVRKTGPGTVTYFEEPSTYTGPTVIEAGTLALKADATLGSPLGGTVVQPGATLAIRNNEGDVNLNENITLHGRITDNGGTFPAQLHGGITAAADSASIEVSGSMVTIFSAVSGSVLHKTGIGSLTLGGTSSLPLSGGLFVDAGELRLQKLSPNALQCPAIIGNAQLPAKLTLAAADQLPDKGTVQIVSPSGTLDLGAFTDTLGALVMNGGSLSGSPASRLSLGTLHTMANAASAVISAPLANAGGANGVLLVEDGAALTDLRFDSPVFGTAFEKTGAGRADFTQDIPAEGLDLLVIKEGAALFFSNSGSTAIAMDGGLLGGKGSVGNVSSLAGGVISPGASPGALAGSVSSLNAGTTLRMELNGLQPGDEHDQYAAMGTVSLGNARLELSCPFDPPAGSSFMLIRNVSGAPVAGTFAGLPQNGYTALSGGKIFQISYTGGDGDDVVLTRVAKDGPVITEFSVIPGGDPDKGGGEVNIGVQGVPGISYQLESSPDLSLWTLRKSGSADLLSGLLQLDLKEPEGTKRQFYRVRLP